MTNFISIYSLIYIPFILSSFITKPQIQKNAIFFWICVFTLFRGLRWECGTDWDWYEESFNNIDISNFWRYVTVESEGDTKILEPGWGFLLMLCHYLFGTYTSFLLITNFIRLIFIYKISCFFTNKPIICFVSIIVSENFFPVRQDLANVIFFYGLCWLSINKTKIYIINNLISSLIHSSSIILLPICWILKKVKFKLSIYIACLILSFTLGESLISTLIPTIINIIGKFNNQMAFVISTYYNAIHSTEELNLSNPIVSLTLNLFLLVLFYYNLIYKKGYNSIMGTNANKKTIVFLMINAFVLNIIINQIFLRNIPPLARLSSYLVMSFSVLFSIYYHSIRNYKMKILAILFFISYMFYKLYKHFGFYPELMFPYRSIFGIIH